MRRGLVVLAAAACAWAAPSAHTQEPAQGPTFRTGVDLITVDVGVSDERGRPVTDLGAAEFIVKIDGKPRRVVSAEQVRIDVEAAKREAAANVETLFTSNLVPPNGRMILIAVDQANIRPGAARPILAAAARFLDRLSPADSVAFVAFPPPGPAIGFTADHRRIRQAMQQVTGSQSRFKGKFNIGVFEAIAITENNDELMRRQVVQRECGFVTGPELERCEREVETEAAEITMYVRQDTMTSLRSLRDLLARVARLDGPKSLILVSEGLVMEDLGGELEDIVRIASFGRISINVLLMDVPRFDVTQSHLPPSATQDRELQVQGLETLAGMSRGGLYRVIGTGDAAFDRLASETSAYYVLGVEQEPGDRDGKRHRIDVEVRRRGVTLRSRRAFVLAGAPDTPKSLQERLTEALQSPFAVTELPIRLTTYAYQDPGSPKVRVVLAADVGQAGSEPAEYLVGYAAIDDQGEVASSGAEKRVLSPPGGRPGASLAYAGVLSLEPGTYAVRFAAVDAEGRRGSVVREVHAWQMAGQEFAFGDLMVGSAPSPGGQLQPAVEPLVQDGRLAAYLEIYGSAPAAFENASVALEVADDEDAPAILTVPVALNEDGKPDQRVAQTVVGTRILPPGRYVARAQVVRGGKPAGVLVRPFIVTRPSLLALDAAPPALPASMLGGVPAFDRQALLRPDVIGTMLDVVERASPALKPALAEARAGRYGPAALEALSAGDQSAASFLRGVDLFAKGQLDQAAAILQAGAGPRREYFPAALYLGACFAAAGRDRDAAGIWQLAIGREPRPPFAYALAADARLRDGQPEAAIAVLKPAFDRTPDDPEIARRLWLAYLMTGRYEDALPVLDAYLARRPEDGNALFPALMAHYEVLSRRNVALEDGERAKITRYARAYKGPMEPLVTRYLVALGVK